MGALGPQVIGSTNLDRLATPTLPPEARARAGNGRQISLDQHRDYESLSP